MRTRSKKNYIHPKYILTFFQKFASDLAQYGQRREMEGAEQASIDKAALQDREEGERAQAEAQEGDEEESGQVQEVKEGSRGPQQLSL